MIPTVRRLSNGARIICARDENLRSVAVVPGIRIGSRFETSEQKGLSHFVEHLIFKGTAKYPTAEGLSRAVDRLGGDINASTGRELTSIQVRTACRDEMTCAEIAMELLCAPLLRDEDIERERLVVCDEIKMYEADDQQRALSLLQTLLFGEHPLGRPVAGSVESIRDVDPDRIRSFHSASYIPREIVVTLAGNYSEAVERYVEERLLAGAAPVVTPLPTDAHAQPGVPKTSLLEAFTPRATIFLGFHGPTQRDERTRTALSLLGNILGGYMSSRLFVELREKLSLCYAVGSGFDHLSDASMMYAWTMLEPEQLPKAIVALGTELRRVLVDLVEEELTSAKSHVSGSTVLANEHCLYTATLLTDDLLMYGQIETTEEKIARYDSITLDEVRNAARLYLKNVQTAIVSPSESLKGLEDICANELGAALNGS